MFSGGLFTFKMIKITFKKHKRQNQQQKRWESNEKRTQTEAKLVQKASRENDNWFRLIAFLQFSLCFYNYWWIYWQIRGFSGSPFIEVRCTCQDSYLNILKYQINIQYMNVCIEKPHPCRRFGFNMSIVVKK